MSVARRVGQELLADYGEKVLALEASDYLSCSGTTTAGFEL